MSFGGPDNPYQPPYPPPPQPYPYVPQPQPYRSPWAMLQDLRGAEWPPLRVLLRGGQPRIHGCVWAALLLPCFWFVVWPLMAGYVFARSARGRAHRLFPPHAHRLHADPPIARIQKARALTAVVMSVLLLAVYGKPEDVGQAQEQYVMRLVVTPPLLLLSAPVVIAVLFRWASADTRAHMRARVRAAVKAVLWYIGAVTATPLIVAGIVLVQRDRLTATTTADNAVAWQTVVLMVPFLWLLFFLFFATGPAVRSGFNSAAVHAALPALLTGVLVWEFALISLAAGGLPPGPPFIAVLAFLGGPASVTAVAWWEIRRLRERYGVRLRV